MTMDTRMMNEMMYSLTILNGVRPVPSIKAWRTFCQMKIPARRIRVTTAPAANSISAPYFHSQYSGVLPHDRCRQHVSGEEMPVYLFRKP